MTEHESRSITEAFCQTADRFRDRIAIEDEGERISYAELNDRVGAFTRLLRESVGGANSHIALLADPGIDAVTAILGILGARHTYVPLDPLDPHARLNFILDHSDATTIVASQAHEDLARRLAGDARRLITISEGQSGHDATATYEAAQPDDIALLMYTSGSTGRPKGVLQTHRNLLHYSRQYSEFLGIEPADRLTMLYSLSFAASSMDIYGALLRGATLCFFNARQRGPARLAAWIQEQGITVLHTVPTLFRHMLETLEGGADFSRVRAIDLGGEPVFARDVALCRTRFRPECRLVNHLAATELSVIAQYDVREAGGGATPIPVGRPAAGVIVQILRSDGSPAAHGEPGDIRLHSPFLSPGYWNDQELTAAAFADDAERPGWRTYRSGDRGVLRGDGMLVALGRQGDAVKIRGHSVHLAEVEASLRQVPGVDDVAVVAFTDSARAATEPMLVAYYASRSVEERDLRGAARRVLPHYATPSRVCRVDDFPRTASGKIDRRALAERIPPASNESEIVSPEGPLEKDVAALFSGILDVPLVGRDQDFFELGGDSLKLAELQIELERRLKRELTPQDLVEDPTVAGIAALMDRVSSVAPSDGPEPLLVPIRSSGSRTPLFLVHGGGGRAETSRRFLDAIGDDQPLYGFQARGRDLRTQPYRSVHEMAAAYVAAMREIQPSGPYYLGSACAGVYVAHEMACQLREAREAVAPLLLIDPSQPLHRHGRVKRLARLATLLISERLSRLRLTRPLVVWGRLRYAKRLRVQEWREDSIRVWFAFRIASYTHQLRVFDGDAHVIGTHTRLRAFETGAWNRHIRGNIKLFEVEGHHNEVFDPANATVANYIGKCVREAQDWIAYRDRTRATPQ